MKLKIRIVKVGCLKNIKTKVTHLLYFDIRFKGYTNCVISHLLEFNYRIVILEVRGATQMGHLQLLATALR